MNRSITYFKQYLYNDSLIGLKGVIDIKAVLMAGGKGTRLRPLTCNIPKPMVPILNKPIMEYSINLLKKFGVEDMAVTMAYLPSIITDHFGRGEELGVNLHYFVEETPLGTGGSVKNAEEFLDDTFIVISGDALTDIDIKKAIEYHRIKKSKATLLLKKEPVPLEYGVIVTDDHGKIIRFLEKPSWGEVFSDTINTGIYILEPEVLDYYKKGDNFDFSKDLFPKLLRDKVPMYGYVIDDYWCDVGDLGSYMQSQFDVIDRKVKVTLNISEIEKGIWIDEGVKLSSSVKLHPPVYIGKNSIIGESVNIGPYAIIEDNCCIEEGASLKKTIVWNNSKIGRNAECRGSVICNNALIEDRGNLFEGSVVGAGSILSSGVVVKPNIKIWPDKKVEENTVVYQNLIWGTKVSKTLFGYRDISGEVNIDITPEFVSRLGSAFASVMKGEDTYVIGCDDSSAANNLKNALTTGILSTGAGVIDISSSTMAMNRFAVRHYNADGGVYIRMDYSASNIIRIEFINRYGANIDRTTERKIENIFNRGDFERCNSDKINDVVKIHNFSYLYTKGGVDLLQDISKIKRRNPSLIVASRSDSVINNGNTFFKRIGCQVKPVYLIDDFRSVDKYFSYISREVTKRGADMGIIFSENGENIILIDEKGRVIDKEKYLALISLVTLKASEAKKLVMPNNSPNILENMAKEYGAEVIRTKSNLSDIMNEMLNRNNYTKDSLLQYTLYFDGIWGAGKIIDFLVQRDMSLGELFNEIPDFYFIKKEIECEWKDKGRIIREIIEEYKDKDIELFEGVKINDSRGWALILPDSEKPVFNIYTEGCSEEYAEELSSFFSEKVKNLLKNQGR